KSFNRAADLGFVHPDRTRNLSRNQGAGLLQQEDDTPIQFDELVLAGVGKLRAFADHSQNLPEFALNHMWRSGAFITRHPEPLPQRGLDSVEDDLQPAAELGAR